MAERDLDRLLNRIVDAAREAVERGFGLVGMRERAALVGGEVRVLSKPGQGTAVHAKIPSRPGDEAGVPATPPATSS